MADRPGPRRPRPPSGPPKDPGARGVALAVVRRVWEEGAYSNLALPAELDRSSLRGRDRDLATELSYGTLRRLLRLDHALETIVDRGLSEAEPPVLAALRLGAYQVLFTRIPPHAAVGETVSLAPERARGFVNAVLRRLSRRGVEWPHGDADGAITARTGLAPWMVRELRRVLPDEEVELAAGALAEPGGLTIRTNECAVSSDELERALHDAGHASERGSVHPGSFRLAGGRPTRLPGFADGWFAVQDEASSFVVDALGVRPGDRVLDACAGPGGKAAHAACLAGQDGLLAAADVTAKRVHLVGETARRLGLNVRLLVQDARRPALVAGFDRILVDAPCSGLGSARRRPELLWRPRKDDLSRMARLQVAVVTGAAELLRPGGTLVYSVCTYPQAETDAVADALRRHSPDLKPEPFSGPASERDGASEPDVRLRLWPHVHGTDAMFIARFRKASSP